MARVILTATEGGVVHLNFPVPVGSLHDPDFAFCGAALAIRGQRGVLYAGELDKVTCPECFGAYKPQNLPARPLKFIKRTTKTKTSEPGVQSSLF